LVIGLLYGKIGVILSSIKSFAIAGVLYPASAIIALGSFFFIFLYKSINVLLSCSFPGCIV